jgi:hypothetical protein
MTDETLSFFATARDDEQFLASIGKAVVEFSKLESELSGLAIQLLKVDDPASGQIATSELSFKQTVQLLMSLYRHRVSNPDQVVDMRVRLDGCHELEAIRNLIVHSRWTSIQGLSNALRQKTTAKFKHGLLNDTELVSTSTMLEFVEEVRSLRQQFVKEGLSWLHSL